MTSEDIDIALAVKQIYSSNGLTDPTKFEQSRSAELRTLDRCTGKTTFKVILALAYAQQGKRVNYIVNARRCITDIESTLARYTDSAQALRNVHISVRGVPVIGRALDIIIEDLYE